MATKIQKFFQSTAPKPFVFVLMPFSDDFKNVYELGIKAAAKEANAYAERVDEQMYSEGILERIYNQINKADVIVADMTGENANVFYEVGYAHALGKVVILLTQNASDIPLTFNTNRTLYIKGDIVSLKSDLKKMDKWGISENLKKRKKKDEDEIELVLFDNQLSASVLTDLTKINLIEADNRFFRLRFIIRNTSSSLLQIESTYIFSSEKSNIYPCFSLTPEEDQSAFFVDPWYNWTEFSFHKAFPQEIDKGFHKQYKLNVKISSLPPNASDYFDIAFLFKSGNITEVEETLLFRLHSISSFYDFPFKNKDKQ